MSDIQTADSRVCRSTIILFLVTCVLLAPLLWWLNAYIASHESWVAYPEEGAERAKLTIVVLVVSSALLILVVAGYVNKLANSILNAERDPPPDKEVIRNIKIFSGNVARRIGKILKDNVLVVLLLVVNLIIVGRIII